MSANGPQDPSGTPERMVQGHPIVSAALRLRARARAPLGTGPRSVRVRRTTQTDHPRRSGSRERPPRGRRRAGGAELALSWMQRKGARVGGAGGGQEAGTRRRAPRDWSGTVFVVWLVLRGKRGSGWRGGDKRKRGCSPGASAELPGQFCRGSGSESRGHVVGRCPRVCSASRDHPVPGRCSSLAAVRVWPSVGSREELAVGPQGTRAQREAPGGETMLTRPGPQPVSVQPSPGFILMRASGLFIL